MPSQNFLPGRHEMWACQKRHHKNPRQAGASTGQFLVTLQFQLWSGNSHCL
jgi:hypothetical protein